MFEPLIASIIPFSVRQLFIDYRRKFKKIKKTIAKTLRLCYNSKRAVVNASSLNGHGHLNLRRRLKNKNVRRS